MSAETTRDQLSQHAAIHQAEADVCAIADICIAVVSLRALSSLDLGDDLQKIMDAGEAINTKLKAAHAKYEHGMVVAP